MANLGTVVRIIAPYYQYMYDTPILGTTSTVGNSTTHFLPGRLEEIERRQATRIYQIWCHFHTSLIPENIFQYTPFARMRALHYSPASTQCRP